MYSAANRVPAWFGDVSNWETLPGRHYCGPGERSQELLSGAGMNIVIGTVTFENTPCEMNWFAASLKLAEKELDTTDRCTLVFVDHGAPSGLDTLLPQAIRLDSCGTRGFGPGMNRLLQFAFKELEADVFICANPDGTFHHQTIRRMTARSRSYPGSLIEATQFPGELAKVYDPVSFETPWASACCLLIPREIYGVVGDFDDNFFAYLEDVDYSWRTRLHGFSVKIFPDVLYAHSVVARGLDESSNLSRQRLNYESGRYFGFKWHNDEFRCYCDDKLLSLGFYCCLSELPPLPEVSLPINKSDAKRVACFSKPFFTWGEFRW